MPKEKENKSSKYKSKKDSKKNVDFVETSPSPIKKPTRSRARRIILCEDVMIGFEDLVKRVENEIEYRRNNLVKDKGIMFLRSLNKDIKMLNRLTVRAMKQKNPKTNRVCGFKKPVPISKDMAKFGGWEPDLEVSRSDVTAFISKYIRDHELYNPDDKRQFTPDVKLAKLLNWDKRTENEPLNYWKLQTRMKHLFPKTEDI